MVCGLNIVGPHIKHTEITLCSDHTMTISLLHYFMPVNIFHRTWESIDFKVLTNIGVVRVYQKLYIFLFVLCFFWSQFSDDEAKSLNSTNTHHIPYWLNYSFYLSPSQRQRHFSSAQSHFIPKFRLPTKNVSCLRLMSGLFFFITHLACSVLWLAEPRSRGVN